MLLSNLTGVQFAAAGGPAGVFVPGLHLYGNPGDYAWGRGGLDAVVTSLLNQVSGN
jgi:E3 ubiquitin-protein ligase RNF115/126